MIDVLRAYLQVASGVGEVTRQRAMEAARQALATSAAGVVLPVAVAGVDGLTAQASALADDLMAVGRQNRELLRQLVRAEVETVVTRLNIGGQADLEQELRASRRRVRELEQTLASASAPRGGAVTRRATTRADAAADGTAKKSTTKKSTTKKSTTKKSTATDGATTQASATRKAANRTPARRASTPSTKDGQRATTKATATRSAATASSRQSTAAQAPAAKSKQPAPAPPKRTAKKATGKRAAPAQAASAPPAASEASTGSQ